MTVVRISCKKCDTMFNADTNFGSNLQCPNCGTQVQFQMNLLSPGMEFEGFKVIRKLGTGGMGEVWLAEQLSMSRQVVLKILHPELAADKSFVERFHHEIKLAGKLSHPNIVTALHAGVYNGIYYMAMTYVDGVQLEDLLKIDKRLPEKKALRILRPIAEALAYAWNTHKILHRDIKPANIMLDTGNVPKLMDMGISKSVNEDNGLTITGTFMGSPVYMSPEQAKSEREVDCRSDIFAFGATLYHLVTGLQPYETGSLMEVLTQLISADPLPSPKTKNPALSDECSDFIEYLTKKDPSKRPQTWEAVISCIDKILKEKTSLCSSLELSPEEPVLPIKNKNDGAIIMKIDPVNNETKTIKIVNRANVNGTGAVVGIDLGTTYSAIAWVNDAGKVEVIPNSEGYSTTPSVIFKDGNTVLVGREAARAALLEPENSAECFKRDIGHDVFSKKVAGRQMRPEELSAYVLKKLKQDAEDKIGPISDAVITVPAYFDDNRRKATQDAGRIAGLNVIDIINEPSAAALWYGYQNESGGSNSVYLVYDLGGGTFDATLMKVSPPNQFETVATDGDVMLGGKDWDKRLFDYIAGEFMKKGGADPRDDDIAYQELALRIEESKRALSKRESVSIPVTYASHQLRIQIDREKFRDLTADLLLRTQTTVELLLNEAGLKWSNVDKIIAVGGSSRMVMVKEMLEKISGKTIDTTLDPDLAVAQGAALHAASIKLKHGNLPPAFSSAVSEKLLKLKHKDVNSHSLGIEIEDEKGLTRNFIIIPRNTSIPCSITSKFGISATVTDSTSSLTLIILEGESEIPDACVKIGECVIAGLPPGLPEGSPVEVTFSYSDDGRIHVDAFVRNAGVKASAHIHKKMAVDEESIAKHSQTLMMLKII